MSVIDDVKLKTDIVQVIGQHTKLTKAGRMFRGLCPFHSEKDPSFYVYPEQQTWHCFGACSTGGDVFSFVMKKEGLDFREALETLAERAGVVVPSTPQQIEKKEEKHPLYEANAAAATFYYDYLLTAPAARKVRDYVAGRGIIRKSIEAFQIGVSPEGRDSLKQHLTGKGLDEKTLLAAGLVIQAEDGHTFDRFHGRLMFPIRDARGQVTGFGARALDDSMPKYMNSPQTAVFDKSGGLYAIDLAAAAIRKQDQAIIVEGYVDAIVAHQNTISNVVASMGTSITDKQVTILKKMTRNLVLALDPDAAGEEAMLRCVTYEAITGSEIKVMSLPEGKDPDEVIKDDPAAGARLVEQARPVMDCTFESLLAGLDMTKPGDKQAAVDRLLPVIGGIANVVRQAHYLQRLARTVNVREPVLEAELGKLRRASGSRQKSGPKEDTNRTAPSASDPLEEYFLALLVQHPELRKDCAEVSPDLFNSTENREIFERYRSGSDLTNMADQDDPFIGEHIVRIKARQIAHVPVEQLFAYYHTHLQESYLRNLEARHGEILALEVESSGPEADVARLQIDGIQSVVKRLKIDKTLGKRR